MSPRRTDLPLLRATFEAHRASGDVLGLQPLLIALAGCGDVDFGSLAGDDVLDRARRTGAVAVVSWIQFMRAMHLTRRGRLAAATSAATEAVDLAHATGELFAMLLRQRRSQ